MTYKPENHMEIITPEIKMNFFTMKDDLRKQHVRSQIETIHGLKTTTFSSIVREPNVVRFGFHYNESKKIRLQTDVFFYRGSKTIMIEFSIMVLKIDKSKQIQSYSKKILKNTNIELTEEQRNWFDLYCGGTFFTA